MEYRSSNVTGFVHYGGDVVSNVQSSHGVKLSGGSTGGSVEPVGDDANISITVRGKGTGKVSIANSSQVTVVGGALTITGASTLATLQAGASTVTTLSAGASTVTTLSAGASTLATISAGASTMTTVQVGATGSILRGFYSTTIASSHAAITALGTLEVAFSTALGGTLPPTVGDLVSVEVVPTVGSFAGFRLAANASTRLTVILLNNSTAATSTGRITGRVSWADLT